MHITLHLTNACNLSCKYCYVKKNTHYMSEDTAKAAVQLALSISEQKTQNNHCGLVFFGGEPLLCRELIYKTVDYANSVQRDNTARFHYKITTNGTLLDDEFLRFSHINEIFIAMSHDGIEAANDMNRITADFRGTYRLLEEKARLLLKYRPFAPVMMTVTPGTVLYYADCVDYLYSLGFRYLICSLDYSGNWTNQTIDELERQYILLSKWYYDKTTEEEKFYFSPFDVKISSWINRGNYRAERCELGKKQISVAPDGKLYPCVQFVGDEEYCIGSVFDGINEQRRLELYRLNEIERDTCLECAIRSRCNHYCACLNKQSTGSIQEVSPVLCANERILMPIADRLAEKLYRERSPIFLQKQYNDMFPMISLVEEKRDAPQ